MARSRRVRLTLTLATLVVVTALVAAGGLWAAALVKRLGTSLDVGCRATVDGNTYSLAADQTENAALISAIALRRGMPARAASIGLAVALQESRLRNIEHGDLDSLGLFQQRPSQGWGTQAQILDPVFATNAFYDELDTVPGYATLPITVAAQRVQRSAYPDAYAQHEPVAKGFASALTGYSPAALSCTLRTPETGGTAAGVLERLTADYGSLPAATAPDGRSVEVDVSGTRGWSVAQWAVANAQALAITDVAYDGRRWSRNANDGGTNAGWQSAPHAPATVRITVQGP